MTQGIQQLPEYLLPSAHLLARYRISSMTLFRWLNDDKLGFPQPIRINRRRYWRVADLRAFEVRQAAHKTHS